MKWVIGSDEAGYGNWAGNLIVAGTALPEGWSDPAVTDSKKLSHKARVAAVKQHKQQVLWVVKHVKPEEIDARGVYRCCIEAHRNVHKALRIMLFEQEGQVEVTQIVDGLEQARALLNAGSDGVLIPMSKADTKIPAVSLASCFAKVTQCLHMDKVHEVHPEFGFNKSRGYGTPAHQEALLRYGVLDGVHRKSYAPIKRLILEAEEKRADDPLLAIGADIIEDLSVYD